MPAPRSYDRGAFVCAGLNPAAVHSFPCTFRVPCSKTSRGSVLTRHDIVLPLPKTGSSLNPYSILAGALIRVSAPGSHAMNRNLPSSHLQSDRSRAVISTPEASTTQASIEAQTTAASSTSPSMKILRQREVRDRTGLSRTTLWRLERRGAFPRRRQLSTNSVGWLEDEVIAWIKSRAYASG